MSDASGAAALAAIFGCAGPALTAPEREFFAATRPVGFILFARNIESPEQVCRLTDALRDCAGGDETLILIDQEGGRVARLPAPPWRAAPAADSIGRLYRRDAAAGVEAAELNAFLIGRELRALGVNVNCAPVLDLQVPDAHGIIGDRSYGAAPEDVAALARAACNGFMRGGVIPVIKHIPGHGRAMLDSHHALPIVETARPVLQETDFAPFRALRDMPCAMTAHVVYSAIDPLAATVSPTILREIVRGLIGFEGLLVSDDLSMEALQGTIAQRARSALAAGCDLALHCNGEMEEMSAMAAVCGPLSTLSAGRLAAARMRVLSAVSDQASAAARLEALLSREISS